MKKILYKVDDLWYYNPIFSFRKELYPILDQSYKWREAVTNHIPWAINTEFIFDKYRNVLWLITEIGASTP